MNRAIIAIAVTLAPAVAAAEAPLTLDEVLHAAGSRPAAAAASDEARALDAVADIERRRALFPSLAINASGEQRNRALSLATPDGVLEVAGKRRVTASVGLRQPLLEPSRLLYNAPAARTDARAAAMSAARTRELLAAHAARSYFDVLELDARARAVAGHVTALETRLGEIESLVAEGRAIDRDRRRLRLALDDARLSRDNLARQRRVATLALGHAIGRDVAVEPAPLAGPTAGPTAEAPRHDVRALSLRREAVLARRAGVLAELAPTVSLQAAWIYDDSLFADQDNFFAVTLNLSWTPLAGGTRSARRRALAAEASALGRQQIELKRQVTLERAAAERGIESAQAALAVAERGLGDAAEARRVTIERYRSGRETVGDLLEIEALVRQRQTAQEVARIAVARARIELRLARGTL